MSLVGPRRRTGRPAWGGVITAACTILLVATTPADSACRVGLEVRTVFDGSRLYGNAARPVRIVVWYPARAAATSAVSDGALAGADWASPAQATPAWNAGRATRAFAARLRDMRNPTAPEAAYAARGCAGWVLGARDGRWPLVLIGSGLGSGPHFHARLAEVLADAGVVVAVVAILGDQPGRSPGIDGDSIRVLAEDAAFAIRALEHDPMVDPARIGLVAWSVSGLVHLTLAPRVPGLRALIGLDSGVGYDYGPRLWHDINGTNPPPPRRYLHLRAGVRSSVATDETLVRQLGAEVEVAPGLAHAHFTDLPWERAEIVAAQNAMRRRVRDFLLSHVAR